MTEVAFHFNAPDKLVYACRFARKMLRNNRLLVIAAPPDVLDVLDGMLWNMAPHDFVAHCRGDSDAQLLDASAIVLVSDAGLAPHHDVLLNLAPSVPQGFGSFAQLIEVVSADDEADRHEARARWRHYAQRGYQLIRHDLVQKAS